jgi:non-heme chloroperoxidase
MRRSTAVLLATGATVAGAAVALRRADARWASGDDPCAPEELEAPAGTTSTIVTDDGAALAVLVAGSGPAVVLPHCWMGSRLVWAPVAHRLVRAGRTVVLYDQRGHGESTVGRDGFTIPRLGADLKAVLEHVDARDAVLGGHSMGGMTIQSLATHHTDVLAERASAIVLVSTACGGLSQGRGDARMARVIGSAGVARAMASPMGHALLRSTVGRQVHRSHLVLTRDLLLGTTPEARSGFLTAMQAMDLRDGIASIGIPTEVIVGTRDTLTPPARASELVDAIPGAKLVTLDGFGHMLPLEAPDEVADALLAAS